MTRLFKSTTPFGRTSTHRSLKGPHVRIIGQGALKEPGVGLNTVSDNMVSSTKPSQLLLHLTVRAETSVNSQSELTNFIRRAQQVWRKFIFSPETVCRPFPRMDLRQQTEPRTLMFAEHCRSSCRYLQFPKRGRSKHSRTQMSAKERK